MPRAKAKPKAAPTPPQRSLAPVVLLFALWYLLQGGGGIVPSVSGPRNVVILHESADNTPAFSRLVVSLRNGATADYFKAKGHKLTVLDVDAKDQDGKPLPEVAAWRAVAGGKLPSVVVLNGNAVLGSQAIAADSTADTVLAFVKAKGG